MIGARWLEVRHRLHYYATRAPRLVAWFDSWARMYFGRGQRTAIRARGPSTLVTVDGHKLRLELAELHDYLMFRELARTREYEPSASQVVRESLRPGDRFIDVGANNGYFTILALSRVGQGGTVVAVEPNPSAFNRLRANLVLNGNPSNVSAVCAAAAAEAGRVPLFLSDLEDGRTSLVQRSDRSVEVPKVRLDDVVPSGEVALVKIDAEGSEREVLRGMEGIQERSPNLRLIVEWNSRYSSWELWNDLARSFDVYVLPGRINPEFQRVQSFERIRFRFCNLLAIRQGSTPPRLPGRESLGT